MSRGKKLGLLFALLVVVLAATIIVTKLDLNSTTSDDTEEETGEALLSLDADAVTALSWTYNGETVSLAYADDIWTYPADASIEIDSTYPDAMVQALVNATQSKVIEDPGDLSDYGLDEPSCTVTVTADEAFEILFGDETAVGGEYYVSIGDGKVYLVDSEVYGVFSYGIADIQEVEETEEPTEAATEEAEATETAAEVTEAAEATETAAEATEATDE